MSVREIDCNGPGMRRRRAGKGFTYLDEDGERIADEEVAERIRSLAIPPAWDDVWICSDPNGHIQATGVDAKGRRQYRYHDEWRAARDREKHDRVLRFAKRLPVLREQVAADITRPGMPRERVLACAVRLLELGFFRIGGEAYAEENDTYGLATLRKHHVRVRGDMVEFDYDAKSGQQRWCQVVDPEVRAVAGVVKDVAEHLGNTPAVARSAYIDPRVVERFEADDTVADVLVEVELEELDQGIPEELEAAVLDLIDRARRRRVKGRRGRATAA